jgi:hypothetical protein
MEKGCVGLSPWGPNVPDEVVQIIEREKQRFESEEYDAAYPFSAGYTKQDGTVVPPGQTRADIDSMSYYVDGVITEMQ